ncbi:alkyl sulfatase dimerization domain-containing protein [Flammeovirga aprica]|uniref:MBL fold metallo-hydrolase n=1 Tax=Flammeovirga aprica JL-4 TaxID=694437 RepID=A0A7X9S077_9BACT|nr:alkyl sulfatase dimerization domain-containing protein [Flammeovirga aprica]NME72000.1 MBL fold metallo-hydrolase [Flammeovirga aprica JL-4]
MKPTRRNVLAATVLSAFVFMNNVNAQDKEGKFKDPSLNYAMGIDVEYGEGANGGKAHKQVFSELEEVFYQKKETIEIAKDFYVITGVGLNASFIVAPEGVIVYDAGENSEDGIRYKEEIRKVTDKPIKAVIYSHSHYVHGTKYITDGEEDVMIIGHPKVNYNMANSGGTGGSFPELQPLQWGRLIQQVQMYLPKEGEDSAVGFSLNYEPGGFQPVTKDVENGEMMNIAGIDLQFFTKGGSDTDDCLTLWVPSRKIAFTNNFAPMMPNLYTPRGADYRDPAFWVESIDVLEELSPEILINVNARAVVGKEEIATRLSAYGDFLRLVMDQTLRGMLQGKGPEELRDFVKLPEHMLNTPELSQNYGTLTWYPPYIANIAMGWWNGDASTMLALPPKARAERLVPALGGYDKVVELAKEAQENKELLWSMELVNYLLVLNEEDQDLLKWKGELMMETGYSQTSSIARGFLLSQGRGLTGKGPMPKNIAPQPFEIDKDANKFIDALRIRINPEATENCDHVIAIEITDSDQQLAGFHVRKGVCQYIDNINDYKFSTETTLKMDKETFLAFFTNPQSIEDLIEGNKIQIEGEKTAVSLFKNFDAI